MPGQSTLISSKVRELMRRVPHPVAVVTSTDAAIGRNAWRGATISSFNTVTIEPTVIVSLNIKRPSATFDAIESSGHFLVHLLAPNDAAARLAQAFTKGNYESPFHDPTYDLRAIPTTQPGMNSTQIVTPPLIQVSKGPQPVAFHLNCHYIRDKTVELGDHVVLFGDVTDAQRGEGSSEEPDLRCLVYADRHYSRVINLDIASESLGSTSNRATRQAPA